LFHLTDPYQSGIQRRLPYLEGMVVPFLSVQLEFFKNGHVLTN
jgi:hypothetical protein